MARWSALTDFLATAEDTCRLTWGELSGVVGDLPPSAAKYRAWWSGDRPHVRAWRAAGFRLEHVSLGQEVAFVREVGSSAISLPARVPSGTGHLAAGSFDADTPQEVPGRDRVLLIACSKGKLDRPAAAKDLYTSPLFRSARAHAQKMEARGSSCPQSTASSHPMSGWRPTTATCQRRPGPFEMHGGSGSWSAWTFWWEGLANRTVEVYAGSAYVKPIAERLTAKGCQVSLPLDGLAVGERLHWYTAQSATAAGSRSAGQATDGHSSSDPGNSSFFAALLLNEERAVTPEAFIQHGSTGLKVPGLYSWWADQQAAADLSEGLGHPVEPGLDLRRAGRCHPLAERKALHQHVVVTYRRDASGEEARVLDLPPHLGRRPGAAGWLGHGRRGIADSVDEGAPPRDRCALPGCR